jgi:hypothetical protein
MKLLVCEETLGHLCASFAEMQKGTCVLGTIYLQLSTSPQKTTQTVSSIQKASHFISLHLAGYTDVIDS